MLTSLKRYSVAVFALSFVGAKPSTETALAQTEQSTTMSEADKYNYLRTLMPNKESLEYKSGASRFSKWCFWLTFFGMPVTGVVAFLSLKKKCENPIAAGLASAGIAIASPFAAKLTSYITYQILSSPTRMCAYFNRKSTIKKSMRNIIESDKNLFPGSATNLLKLYKDGKISYYELFEKLQLLSELKPGA